MSLKQRMSHGPVAYVADFAVADHNKAVIENDALIAGRLALLRDQNTGWLGRRLRKSADAPRRNRSGHGPEHAEALTEAQTLNG